jgi:hypothetical protein
MVMVPLPSSSLLLLEERKALGCPKGRTGSLRVLSATSGSLAWDRSSEEAAQTPRLWWRMPLCRQVLRFGLPQKTSANLERHDLVAMQLEDVVEVHRTTRKIA